MKRTVVLDVVGMTPALMRHAPNLTRLAARGAQRPIHHYRADACAGVTRQRI